MPRPPASIVILAWNEWRATRACLDSLRPTLDPRDQVIVVDNGSVDHTPKGLKWYPWVQVVTNEQNLGFAGGCNSGAAIAGHEAIVFLNNDTLLVGRWLDALLEAFVDPQVAAAGSRSNSVSGQQLVVEPGCDTDRLPEIRRFEREWRQRHAGQFSDVSRLVGFCLAVRRDAFEAIGGFDEGFGIGGFEDDDLCTRLIGAGHRLVISHASFVHHDGHRTFDANGVDWFALQEENAERYRRKHRTSVADADVPLLSACLIVRDEEERLAACLASLRDVVDEVVVYDTGSVDTTVAIAQDAGATVVQGTWEDDFGRARNSALDACSGTWILHVDADEELVLHGDLRSELTETSDEALSVMIDNVAADGQLQFQHRVVRLFRRQRAHWEGRLHEQVVPRPGQPALRHAPSASVGVRHWGYDADEAGTVAKQERNIRIARAAVTGAEAPDGEALVNLALALCAAGQADEGLLRFHEALATPLPAALRRRALREGIGTLIDAHRPAEALEWLEHLRLHALDGSAVAYLESVALANLGELTRAADLLRPLRAASDGDGYYVPDKELHLRRGLICLQARHWPEALESLLTLAALDIDGVPWAPLALASSEAGGDAAQVARFVTDDNLVEALGQLLNAPPAAVDLVAEELWKRFGGDVRMLACVAKLAPKLELERALEWSARLRAAGLAAQCPLVAIAREGRNPLDDRLRAVAILSACFDAEEGDALLAVLAKGVQASAFKDSLLVLDALAPDLLPRFVELLATTAPRCASLSEALEQLGASEEAAIVATMGRALEPDREPEAPVLTPAAAPPGVFVLGMHRSGTSAVTRVLNLLGPACAGEDDLMPADDAQNPRGFWESASLSALNDEVLEQVGASWSAPPAPTAAWPVTPDFAALAIAGRAALERSHGTVGGWVWKDPRTCLTFDFWSAALPVTPVIVLPYRNPLEVWRSLERRDGFSKAHALALWERYTRSALEAALGRPTLVTSYEDLLAAPESWCERAATFLGDHGLDVDLDAARPAIEAFLEPSLRRAAFSSSDLDQDDDVTPAQRALWARLEAIRGSHECFDAGALPTESFWVEPLLEARRNVGAPESAPQDHQRNAEASSVQVTARTSVPRCSIVIPLFNKVEYTERCLQSLIDNTDDDLYELVLVDNASSDDTASLLRQLEGDVVIIRNEENLGFARASNQGAWAARGEHLLFLNNDTEAHPGWLPPLLAALDRDPATVAVGSRLLFPDGRIQHAGVHVVEDRRPGHIPLAAFHRSYCAPAEHAEVMERRHMSVLTGASLLVRRDAFFAAGGFDEAYWNGYEDVDLCFKLREQGGNLIYEPTSCLVHHESISGPERFSREDRNVALLVDRWTGRVPADVVISASGAQELVEGAALQPVRQVSPTSGAPEPDARRQLAHR